MADSIPCALLLMRCWYSSLQVVWSMSTPPLNLGGPLGLPQPTEKNRVPLCDFRNQIKYAMQLHLALLGCSFLEPSHHAVRKPSSQKERSCVGVVANSPGFSPYQKLALTTRHIHACQAFKWFQRPAIKLPPPFQLLHLRPHINRDKLSPLSRSYPNYRYMSKINDWYVLNH